MRVVATSKNAARSEQRCTTNRDDIQKGLGRCDMLSFSTFGTGVLDVRPVTLDKGAAFDCVTLELVASLLDRRC